MLVTSRDRIEKLFDEGKSEAEVVAAKPLADLDATWGNNAGHAAGHTRTSTSRSTGSDFGRNSSHAVVSPLPCIRHSVGVRESSRKSPRKSPSPGSP